SAEPVVNFSSRLCELRVSAVRSEKENWDTNKNSELSQPSSPTTSSDKVGPPVPLSQPQPELVVPASAGPCSCLTSSPRRGCCSRAEHENRIARPTKQSHEAILSCV